MTNIEYDDDYLMSLFYDEVRPATDYEGNYFKKELEIYNMSKDNGSNTYRIHVVKPQMEIQSPLNDFINNNLDR